MATSTWSAWDDDVVPEIPGAPPAFIRHHVKLAAIEFCDRAWVWVVDQGPLAVAAGANEYDWEPPASTEVCRIIRAWIGKGPLTPKTRNELSAMFGDYMRAAGSPQYFTQDVPAKLILVPKPTASNADGITAKIAVKPTRAATGVDSVIFNRWFDAIASGAKARLMRMPKKPWTDPVSAESYQQRFDAAIAKAQLEVTRGFSDARLRVRAKFF